MRRQHAPVVSVAAYALEHAGTGRLGHLHQDVGGRNHGDHCQSHMTVVGPGQLNHHELAPFTAGGATAAGQHPRRCHQRQRPGRTANIMVVGWERRIEGFEGDKRVHGGGGGHSKGGGERGVYEKLQHNTHPAMANKAAV